MIITTCTASKFLSTLSLRRATTDYWTPVFTLQFLSTLSLRRATVRKCSHWHPDHDFYPRSPCGERPHALSVTGSESQFLSTLSLRRATNSSMNLVTGTTNFYPRSPCGERLSKNAAIGKPTLISIHALLAESDLYPSI